jgi:phage terminase large subunit
MTKPKVRRERAAGSPTHARQTLREQLKTLKRTYNGRLWKARLGSPGDMEAIHAEFAPQIDKVLADIAALPSKHGTTRALDTGHALANALPGSDATHTDNAPTHESIAQDVGSHGQGAILHVGGGGSRNSAEGGGVKNPRGTLSLTPEKTPAELTSQTSVAPATKRRVIQLPNKWTPRPYQLPVLEALETGTKRAITVWHRRAGKDHVALNLTAIMAHKRVGIYWHVLPTQRQARKAVWEGIGKDGYRLIDQAFPKELRKRTRDDDMMIEFTNGSIWRCVGGDSFDGLVGSNPVGVVFSEFSIMDPRGWRFTSPILAENGGWAWFIGTPRGKNHFHDLYDQNKDNPDWFCELLTIEDSGAIPLSVIEEERTAGMPENMILQEYYCSFDQANAGTVYGNELAKVKARGGVGNFMHDARYPVETYWDIGVRDATAIIFAQRIDGEVRVIDYYENTNEGFPHYAAVLNSKPYSYSRHVAPHDLEQRIFLTGTSTTQEIAQKFGVRFTIAPKVSLADGIEAGRAMLSRATFNASTTEKLVDALGYYHRAWDEEKRVFTPTPVHDWSSHPCSAWMYGSLVPDSHGLMPQWATNPANLNTGLSVPQGVQIPGLPKGSNGWQAPTWQNPTWAMPGMPAPQGLQAGPYDPLAGWR